MISLIKKKKMEAKKVWFDNKEIWLETVDNKVGKMPLSWFPKLENASTKDLLDFEMWSEGTWIHWEKLGEDLSIEGFFTFKGKYDKVKPS